MWSLHRVRGQLEVYLARGLVGVGQKPGGILTPSSGELGTSCVPSTCWYLLSLQSLKDFFKPSSSGRSRGRRNVEQELVFFSPASLGKGNHNPDPFLRAWGSAYSSSGPYW